MILNEKKPLVIAHRGVSDGKLIENTLPAFERAVTVGADYIEIDIRKTADGQLICYHDAILNGKKVKHMTYPALNRMTQAYGWNIPLLEEVICLCAGKINLNFELKETGLESQILSLIEKYDIYENVLITSYHDVVLKAVKMQCSAVRTGLVVGRKQKMMQDLYPERRLLRLRADVVCCHHRLLRKGFLRRMQKLDIPVYVWTVNKRRLMIKLVHEQVAGIITDEVTLCKNIVHDDGLFSKKK